MSDEISVERPVGSRSRIVGAAASWMVVALLAWAPFPLGSNRPWSWDLLAVLVCIAWLAIPATARTSIDCLDLVKRLALPLALYGSVLLWGWIQSALPVPQSWAHPVWKIAADTLGHPVAMRISIDPWQSETSLLKFATYGLFFLFSATLALDATRAERMLRALVAISLFYAVYAFVMSAFNLHQDELFYRARTAAGGLAAPFVNRNSFATYMGLGALLSVSQLVRAGQQSVVASRGGRQLISSLMQYLFGRGTVYLIAALATSSALMACGSRAGFLSTLVAAIVLAVMGGRIAARTMAVRWAFGAGLVLAAFAVILFEINGATLVDRLNAMVDTGGPDNIRLALWQASTRMIGDAPWLGLGLGTFESAYPFYAGRVLPFVMDRAHNDYLEAAAGLGLPAAIALWSAIALIALQCFRGIGIRRRNRLYPLLGFVATILVATHSAFDFGLQIPAVAMTYAAILGIAVAQSFPTRRS